LEQLLAPFADPDMALVYGRQRGNEQTNVLGATDFCALVSGTVLFEAGASFLQ